MSGATVQLRGPLSRILPRAPWMSEPALGRTLLILISTTDVLPIHLNADVTSVTVPIETAAELSL